MATFIYSVFFQETNQTPTEDGDTPADRHEGLEVCIICKAPVTLKVFKKQTWGTFKKASETKFLLRSDCYRSTTLKVNLKQEAGDARYHYRCYKNYTAVKKASFDFPE